MKVEHAGQCPKINPRTSEVIDFLAPWGPNKREELEKMLEHSYPTWSKASRDWNMHSGLGGTYQLKAIQWYQHEYHPGSTVSKYTTVMRAIHKAIDEGKEDE